MLPAFIAISVAGFLLAAIVLYTVLRLVFRVPVRLALVGRSDATYYTQQISSISRVFALVVASVVILSCIKLFYPILKQKYEFMRDVKSFEDGIKAGEFSASNAGVSVSNFSGNTSGGNILLTTEMDIKPEAIGLDTNHHKLRSFVVAGYSAGQYRISSIRGGNALLQKMGISLKGLINKWSSEHTSVSIKVLGQSDGIPSRSRSYRGDLGNIDTLVYSTPGDATPKFRAFKAGVTRLSNNDYALLRAYDTYRVLDKNLKATKVDYHLYTNEVKLVGSTGRKVIVVLSIINGLNEHYSEYNTVQKMFHQLCMG